jgi:hypothetical protein
LKSAPYCEYRPPRESGPGVFETAIAIFLVIGAMGLGCGSCYVLILGFQAIVRWSQ